MGPLRSRLARLGLAALLGSTLLGLTAGATLGAQGWLTEMAGDAVVPGPGDPDGFGIAILTNVDPANGELCWTLSLEGLSTVTAIQILHGTPIEAGTIAFDLTLTIDADGLYADCLGGQDAATLQDVIDNTGDYAVQVATDVFDAGAIRGQLESATVNEQVNAGTMICPEGIETLDDARTAGAGQGPSSEGEWNICAPTYPTGLTLPDPGEPWLVEPVQADLDLSVLPDGWSERLVTDARFFFGNGVCDTVQHFCTSFGWFEWGSIPSGDVTINQNLIPDGYHLGWARIFVDGSDTIGSSSSVPLTLAGDEQDVNVWYFDVPDVAPAPSGTLVPPASSSPVPTLVSLTPPPTSTIDGEGRGAGGSALVSGLLLIASIGAVTGLIMRRRPSAD